MNISVVLPTYNRSAFLPAAIDSVLRQTYLDFELIIVDDGSNDSTRVLVERYQTDKIRYFFQENKGPAAARNTGIRHAQGRLIAFLDSDDWWHKDKLALQVCAMETNPDYFISHTQEIWYRNGEHLNQRYKHRKEQGVLFQRSLELCVVGMSTMMARRELFDSLGLFDEQMPCCEDYDLWLRASVRFPFLLVDKALTVKNGGHSDQLSRRFSPGMDQYRIYSIKKLLEGGELSADQRDAAIREFKKKCLVYGKGCLRHNKTTEGNYYRELPLHYQQHEHCLVQ